MERRSWVRRNPAATVALLAALLIAAPVSLVLGVAALVPRSATEPAPVSMEASAPAESPTGEPAPPAAAPMPEAVAPAVPDPGPTSDPAASPSASPQADGGAAAPSQTALAAVGLLEVKGRAPKTGYARDLFGQGWVDVDRNGCDTRNDMLARDLTAITYEPGTRDCVVLSGTLADPYSGSVVGFQRGNDTSTAVQIDHVVALSDAWQKGAQQWDEATRTIFANAPLNLLAVDGGLNQQKGDGDTATWLPPNKPFRCAYVARQVAVKHAFGLWVTPAERDAMVRVLSECPQEPLPTGVGERPPSGPPVVPPPAPSPPPPAGADPAAPPLANPGNTKNCSDFATWPEAQAWFDLHYPAFGDVAHLDGDGNLIACEALPGR